MVYKGHVEKGAIVLDDPVTLLDGTVVMIELAEASQTTGAVCTPSRADQSRPFIGALDGMPEDWSENHDKYLREEHEA
jgi:hypothetical protein